MWDRFTLFMDMMTPELWPAFWLLIGYFGLYLLVLLTSWVWIHLRKAPPPYIDEIVRSATFAGFVLMLLAVVGCAVWVYFQPQYLILWYFWAAYGLLCLVNLMVLVALAPRLRSA